MNNILQGLILEANVMLHLIQQNSFYSHKAINLGETLNLHDFLYAQNVVEDLEKFEKAWEIARTLRFTFKVKLSNCTLFMTFTWPLRHE